MQKIIKIIEDNKLKQMKRIKDQRNIRIKANDQLSYKLLVNFFLFQIAESALFGLYTNCKVSFKIFSSYKSDVIKFKIK